MKMRFLLCLLAMFLCAGTAFADPDESASETTSVNVSKKELFDRARDALKTALETGDRDRADQAFDYLKSHVKEGAPLTRFEEYLINMELKNFGNAIEIYADLRRSLLDSTYKPEWENRITAQDALSFYLYRGLFPFTVNTADSLCARVDSSDISDEYKELYRLLLYSEIAIAWRKVVFHGYPVYWQEVKDTTSAGMFLDRGKSFVKAHPTSPYVKFLGEQTIPFVERVMIPLREFRVDPFKHKYYTGGFGVYLYKWLGFLGGDVTDYVDDKMGSSFMGEVNTRFWRISLGLFWAYGIVSAPKELPTWYSEENESEDESMGLTLGFTVFDSRFLRVEPFLGVSETDYMAMDAISNTEFLLGSNVDVRLLASRPKKLRDVSFVLDLRLKYMLQIGSVSDRATFGDEDEKTVGALRHTFALGLGFEIW